MKHLVCIYILLFALAMPHLNSCQRANTRQELERADSLLECVPMDTNAITELLDKVGAKPNELSHNDSMYYVMLKHDYLIKRFYRLNNDSMMRQAVRHYDKHGTAYDKMRAHYILACMLYDDMKFKESQKECFTATQCNDTTTLRSIKLLGKCYMLLGGISKNNQTTTSSDGATKRRPTTQKRPKTAAPWAIATGIWWIISDGKTITT